MNFSGEIAVKAPRGEVFRALRDARFFASCIDGIGELKEIDTSRYDAMFETRVAYMRFRFNVSVELTRVEPPNEIEAKVEGVPLGVVGRLTATTVTKLEEAGNETRVRYSIAASLTGKLGGLGQPVLRAKAKEMEKQFARRLKAAFEPAAGQAQ